ncbi:MAG: ATP-binding protein [Chlamydiae bacterium]|nr:ATP-binding protein [Chlamydiota bacterium]MBI3277686.1 ATP-binding protein [Chlamydiota bacterium]
MKNPFVYGEEVHGDAFWNRTTDIQELARDIHNGQNVIIFSARRYGKTSLIKTVLERVRKEGVLTVYADLYPAITKEKFIEIYARAVSRSLGKPTQKILNIVKRLFPKLIPKIVIRGEGDAEFEFDYEPRNVFRTSLSDLLQSVHKRAKEEKKAACVVFDEFQEIVNYADDEVEKEMRTIFQSHRNVSYIFLGSKKHLFGKLFQDPNRPFYKSGKHMPLGRLATEEVIKHVREKFSLSGVSLPKEVLSLIAQRGEGHPYYTQLLCHILWDECLEKKLITPKDVENALNKMLKREGEVYETVLNALTQKQKQLLVALALEPQVKVYSDPFLDKYHLGSSSSIQKALQILIRKDLLDRENDQFVFQDSFFALWLQKR